MAGKHETVRVAAGEGRAYFVVGNLNTVKLAGEDTEGAYAVWVDTVARGSGPPPHVHHREHEDFFVLEGEFELFREGQEPLRASAGDFVHTPKGVVHTYRNVGTTIGRLLGIAVPAGFERFVAEVGQPAGGATEPLPPSGEPTPVEVESLVRTAQKYGIEIKLPPPGARTA
jgi:mannose-6-phosphate isomerase-like protein (cupin superfamily)